MFSGMNCRKNPFPDSHSLKQLILPIFVLMEDSCSATIVCKSSTEGPSLDFSLA